MAKQHKIMEVPWEKGHKNVEKLMDEMSRQGWEVVCTSSEHPRSLKLLITFRRDDPAG